MAIRYKGNGRYKYETHNVWNKVKKKYETKWTYLGAIDSLTGQYLKKFDAKLVNSVHLQDKLILNYGDTFALNQYFQKSGFITLLNSAWKDFTNTILSLICYKLLESSAMQHAAVWQEGNYAKIIFKNTNLSTQRISELLKILGNERLQRIFFKLYLQNFRSEHGVVIDSTGLPNNISSELTAFGHHGGSIENEIRMLIVVDKITKRPLYFRYVAGNIVDVSTLNVTISELSKLGVNTEYALLDAGYCSADNIKLLCDNKISFLTRLPSGRIIYTQALADTADTIETSEHFQTYGERALYIQKIPVKLVLEDDSENSNNNNHNNEDNSEDNKKYYGFAYVCCDIKRRAEEISKYMPTAIKNKVSKEDIKKEIIKKGKFVLISNTDIPESEILSFYYLRQSAEQIFKISKSYADILPLRVHSEATLRGVLMLNFLSIIVYGGFREQLPQGFSFESATKQLRNQVCKVYEDESVLPYEPNKKQRLIHEAISNTVGIFSGV
jgi:transposase